MKKMISEIYKINNIPINLQEHMLKAAALAKLLCEKWNGPSINQENIITTMLIHDMGNIAKMDSNNIGDLIEEKSWDKFKQKFINKYGADDHVATFNIASKLGLNQRILWLVLNKIFIHNEMIAVSDDYELKICAYADQRVGPNGILSLENRFDELKERYGTKTNASINHPRSEYLIKSAFDIENQLLKFTTIETADTLNQIVSEMIHDMLSYSIRIK